MKANVSVQTTVNEGRVYEILKMKPNFKCGRVLGLVRLDIKHIKIYL